MLKHNGTPANYPYNRKCTEYKIPLNLAFVPYEKAGLFQTQCMMQEQIQDTPLLKYIYPNTTMHIVIDEDKVKDNIKIEKQYARVKPYLLNQGFSNCIPRKASVSWEVGRCFAKKKLKT